MIYKANSSVIIVGTHSSISGTDPRGWMGWLATHHDLYSFVVFHQNCFQIQPQEGIFSKISWTMAQTPWQEYAECGLYTMQVKPTLSTSPTHILLLYMIQYERPNLKLKPALIYF